MLKKKKIDVSKEEINKNFKVVLRVRPPLPRELEADRGFVNVVKVDTIKMCTISEHLAQGSYLSENCAANSSMRMVQLTSFNFVVFGLQKRVVK